MTAQPSQYDAIYYTHSCGAEPYQHNEVWMDFFNRIADHIVNELQPHSVLDAGCAMGFLVEALRQRGVDAWGIDISEYAIQNVLPDFQPYCKLGRITELFPHPRYDLITSIEVVEHLTAQEAVIAIENLCKHSDDILLSSTPFDFHEPTHANVQPPDYWAAIFNRFGFIHDIDFDASFITPWAMRFVKAQLPIENHHLYYERKIWLLGQEISLRRDLNIEQKRELSHKEIEIQMAKANLYAVLNSNSWRFMCRVQHIRERIIPIGSRREAAMYSVMSAIGGNNRQRFKSFLNVFRKRL
jgi:SAM-dependent methyltransferase